MCQATLRCVRPVKVAWRDQNLKRLVRMTRRTAREGESAAMTSLAGRCGLVSSAWPSCHESTQQLPSGQLL